MTTLWLNGTLTTAAAARIDPADRGFTLGDGVFETMRAEAGIPAHLPRHLARLRHGAAMLGIEIPCADAVLAGALETLAGGGDAALRLTLTRGPMPRGVLPALPALPTLLITSGPLPPPLPAAHLIVARSTRRNEHSPLSRIKSLNYGDSILARQEAAARGADDALLLNTRGDVAEATAASLFLVLGGTLVTPPVTDGALPGIARALLLESGRARVRRITASDLLRAEAGFLANALQRRPIASIDGRRLERPGGSCAGTLLA
jgi:branched-chain amino acid aminotransferase